MKKDMPTIPAITRISKMIWVFFILNSLVPFPFCRSVIRWSYSEDGVAKVEQNAVGKRAPEVNFIMLKSFHKIIIGRVEDRVEDKDYKGQLRRMEEIE